MGGQSSDSLRLRCRGGILSLGGESSLVRKEVETFVAIGQRMLSDPLLSVMLKWSLIFQSEGG
jgi:hypothetical protein